MSKVTIYSFGILSAARRIISGNTYADGLIVDEQIEIYVGDWEVLSALSRPEDLRELQQELDRLIIAVSGAREVIGSEIRMIEARDASARERRNG